MNAVRSPLVSEFETAEQEASFNEWLRTKVAASLSDEHPVIPHDEVMAEAEAVIAEADAAMSRKR